MSLNVYFCDDIASSITAGIVLAVETTTANGTTNIGYIGGVLAMAKYQALSFGISWPALIVDARVALGSRFDELLGDQRSVIEG